MKTNKNKKLITIAILENSRPFKFMRSVSDFMVARIAHK